MHDLEFRSRAQTDGAAAQGGEPAYAPRSAALPPGYVQYYREQAEGAASTASPSAPAGQAEYGGGAVRAVTQGLAEGAHPGVKRGGKGKRRIGNIVGGSFVKQPGQPTGGAPGGTPTAHDGERAFVGSRSSNSADRTTTDGTTSVRMEDENDQQAAMISAAVTRARELLDNAIGKMGNAAGISGAMQANFHTTDAKAVSKVASSLNTIRNAFNGTIPVEVESEGTARAYVYIIWSDIHLCPPWFADPDADGRARTIIHECSHKYCGTADNAYHWDTDKFNGLSAKDALDNADSYAWFCINVR